MADFSKRISILVDFVTGNTSSGLSKIRSDVEGAEGAFGKMKAAGSGAFDLISQNAGAFALGAGTALVGFGAKAVSAFQSTALGAGHLRDALGLSADQASRYLEVSNDLGIGQDSLATAFGRMLKTAGQTPQVFHDLGVQIAYAKDGSVDANQTFLNAVDALHNMTDPAQRAAAATKLFGKSWQDMAEVIDMGAAGLKQRLDDVQSSKIVNDDQIAQGYKFRDALDNVRDAVEGLFIQIGSDLVPTLTTLSGALSTVLGPLDKFNEGLHKLDNIPGFNLLTDALSPLTGGIKTVSDAWDQAFGDGGTVNAANIDPTTQALLDQTTAAQRQANATQQAAAQAAGAAPVWAELVNKTGDWGHAADAANGKVDLFAAGTARFAQVNRDASATVDENNRKLYDSQAATKAATQAQADAADQLDRVNQKLKEQADALKAQADAAQSSADSQIAANDALDAFNQSLAAQDAAEQAAAAATAQHGAASSEAAAANRDLDGAIKGTRDSAISLANATVQHAQDQAAANGQTLSAVGALDMQNAALASTAAQARGPAKAAIESYIQSVNGIPDETMTEINAAIDRGDIATAEALIAQASRTRQTDINVDQVGAASAGSQIDSAARDRHTTIYVNSVGTTSTISLGNPRAAGGPVSAGVVYPVGEQGPELFAPDSNGTIIPNDRINTGGGAGVSLSGGASVVHNHYYDLTVNAGLGTDKNALRRAVMEAISDHARMNGGGDIRRALGIKTVGPIG